MKRETYIDSHNLGERVTDLKFKEGKNDTEIAQILTSEGHTISQPTVSRWLKEKRKEIDGEVSGIIRNHLVEHLPKDLIVIEDLEALTYGWSKEEPKGVLDALLNQEWCLSACARWRESLREACQEAEQLAAAKTILKEALGRVLDFFNDRKEKLNAIKAVRELIAVKLQYSGELGGARQGNIYIVTHKNESTPGPDADAAGKHSGLRLMIKGGVKKNAG